MPKVSAERLVPGSLAEVWDLYFEPTTWPAWVDEFRAIEERDDVYPERGGVLIWRSGPAGRGRVTETVLDHEPRHTHRVSYMDPNSSGQQLTSFEIAGEAVKVRIELAYELSRPTFLPFTDRFFIRPQMEGSIVRSLEGLAAEAQEFTL
jgi:uncharacterized protein YndB with AHSA1/START domain